MKRMVLYCITVWNAFPNLDDSSKTSYVFKYHGCCLWLDERLFFIDTETLTTE